MEPYFFDQRLSAGVDLFARETLSSPYLSYGSTTYGTNLKLGVPVREDDAAASLGGDCGNLHALIAALLPQPLGMAQLRMQRHALVHVAQIGRAHV